MGSIMGPRERYLTYAVACERIAQEFRRRSTVLLMGAHLDLDSQRQSLAISPLSEHTTEVQHPPDAALQFLPLLRIGEASPWLCCGMRIECTWRKCAEEGESKPTEPIMKS